MPSCSRLGNWPIAAAWLWPMPGIYTYWLYDLVTNTPLATLPCKNVSFTEKLNDVGTFNATIPMGDPSLSGLALATLTQPSRSAIYVDRDGTLVWGGILWTRRYNSDDTSLDLAGADFMSYFQHRFLTDLKNYVDQSPLVIAQDLLAWASAVPGGDIGVNVQVVGSSPQLITQQWQPWDYKGIMDAIFEMSSSSPGFDVGVSVAWSGGAPAITLTLTYPRRGRIAPTTGLVWEFPSGNISDYNWPEDGTLTAVTVYEVGAGQAEAMYRASASTPGMLDAGYPLLEVVEQHKDVSDEALLSAYAASDAAIFRQPVPLAVFTVRADMDPTPGSYTVGDDARFRITDFWYPKPPSGGAGFDGYLRINEIDYHPQDDEAESVVLTTGPVIP